MNRHEETIREYFSCWIKNDPKVLERTFSDDIVYSECYVPEYLGIGQIRRWFDGMSLMEFAEDGRICSLKEFQSKAEHEFPYGEDYIK